MIYYLSMSGSDTTPANYSVVNVNAKAIPLQAWTDPEGSKRLRLPDFKTIST
jgi:hypothetical protein